MRVDRRWTRCFVAAGTVALGSLSVANVAKAAVKQAIPAYSIRLEDQLLATLRYLPVTFQPAVHRSTPTTTTTTTKRTTTTTTTTLPTTTTSTTSSTTTTTTMPVSTTTSTSTTTTTLHKTITTIKKKVIVNPTKLVPGTFKWRFTSLPPILRSQWHVGTNNVVLEGALMRFQLVHNFTTTGSMDGATWDALVLAARKHQDDPSTYNYVYVSKTLPEKAKLFVNGTLVFTALVNTGLPGATTANGTFPVYLRYTTTTMSGTNLDGSHYSDSGIPWVSYFNGGDALHGFIRASYGYPQSLGCVEMTFSSAATIWPRTPIGTLVSVG